MRMVQIAALAWGMIGACLIAACGGKVVVDDHGAGGTTTTGTTTGTTGIGGAGELRAVRRRERLGGALERGGRGGGLDLRQLRLRLHAIAQVLEDVEDGE